MLALVQCVDSFMPGLICFTQHIHVFVHGVKAFVLLCISLLLTNISFFSPHNCLHSLRKLHPLLLERDAIFQLINSLRHTAIYIVGSKLKA